MIRRTAIVLAVAMLAAAWAQALAATKSPTRLTLKLNRAEVTDTIKGKVKSRVDGCVERRKLRLVHRGVKDTDKASVIARFRARDDGTWKMTPKRNQNGDRLATPGFYHVKAGVKRIQTKRGPVKCKGRSSAPLYIG